MGATIRLTISAFSSVVYAEMFRTADVDALCNIMAKSALETALKTGLDSARSRLQNQCAEIVRAYRNSGAHGNKQGGGYQLTLPESLQLLPLYVVRVSLSVLITISIDVSDGLFGRCRC
jgi:protein transport protein SEC24